MSAATAAEATPTPGVRWDFRRRVALAALVTILLTVAGMPAAADAAATPSIPVIVRAVPGATDSVQRAVVALGGTVRAQLGLIDAVAAELPAADVERLEQAPGVHSVTENYSLRPLSSGLPGDEQLGSMVNLAKMVGADDMWRHGLTGRGVDVALVDTGVVPVEGLTAPGKVVNGVDVSFESQSDELRHMDTYGHGTNMAGIIAGRDGSIADPASSDGGFQGIAPEARIVNVKVGSASGAADVSQVIAGIDWVVQHRSSGGLNIRVLNLSFGTDSTQSWQTDPLSYAVEVAWRNGIVVVASGGNDGKGTRLAMPAVNPSIIAVGASDHVGTQSTSDDRVAEFSTYANQARPVDLVAPGVGLVSLSSPGSFLDESFPGARVGDRFLRGSGTSQSAAVVSGAAALLLQQRPDLSPNQVRLLLLGSATRLRGTSLFQQGAGLLNLRKARIVATPLSVDLPSSATGTGSLHQSRGSDLVLMDGVELRGEQDIFARPFDAPRWALDAAAGTSWLDGVWNTTRWSGSDWSGASWAGQTWAAAHWSEPSWTGAEWTDPAWSTTRWSTTRWSTTRWSTTRWSTANWD